MKVIIKITLKWNGKGYDINHNILYELKDGNGKVKEYDRNGVLIFEGEYLNGVKNGKGKEYFYNGRLKYEGEYLNGKKWNGLIYNLNDNKESTLTNGNGYIKEYDYNGKLIFEGEYINWKRNGKAKDSYDKGKLKLVVEYLNGERIVFYLCK